MIKGFEPDTFIRGSTLGELHVRHDIDHELFVGSCLISTLKEKTQKGYVPQHGNLLDGYAFFLLNQPSNDHGLSRDCADIGTDDLFRR